MPCIPEPAALPNTPVGPQEKHLTFPENVRGVSYDLLFGPYLVGARQITVTDPYIRLVYQVRNLMEFVEAVARIKPEEEDVAVHLVTVEDPNTSDKQRDLLTKIEDACVTAGIEFTWEFDVTNTIHAPHIITDTGWKISLDRGLDIFQHFDMGDAFTFANRLQQFRSCKAFEVTFLRQSSDH